MIRIFDDPTSVAVAAAGLFAEAAAAAMQSKGSFYAALSGGSTPRRLYEELAKQPWRDKIAWEKVFLFWGDERYVAPTDPLSNQKMTREALLNHVPIPPANLFPIPFAASAGESASLYETTLRTFFGAEPRFDLMLLGLGADGHTASLFPGTAALAETNRWVCPCRPQGTGPDRITLTFPVINRSAAILFLVTGRDKAPVIEAVLDKKNNQAALPVQQVQPVQGQITWFLDKMAAGHLSPATGS
ncbi:6-phosphogluconolactonase [Propionispora hippei]|uniref:6-phosphogluconolactonase n=1 Tax=Propionispora hippei DSM 15287 TaxID=1123003 RepID=A0A1M6BXE6_9FIRM|nr:6-phosphogluconolactonase [Propionispora hippei]SHI53442.1 6-phosphogluconolactonase [Propionispora hippei DSM 15287]